MNRTETVVEGTLKSDGTLELDEKPKLSPGRVTVRLQSLVVLPEDDPFWQRMQAIRAIPRSTPDDAGASTLEEVRRIREEWDDQQRERERLQGFDPK